MGEDSLVIGDEEENKVCEDKFNQTSLYGVRCWECDLNCRPRKRESSANDDHHLLLLLPSCDSSTQMCIIIVVVVSSSIASVWCRLAVFSGPPIALRHPEILTLSRVMVLSMFVINVDVTLSLRVTLQEVKISNQKPVFPGMAIITFGMLAFI